MDDKPNGYTRQPKTDIVTDAEAQTAALLKLNRTSLPKLALLRHLCETQPLLPFSEKARKAGCGIATAERWRKKGLLDPDNYNLALSIAQKIGPEYSNIIVENAAGLVIEGQRQTLRMLPTASAKEASAIAAQQQQIALLETGRATSIVEYQTREEAISAMEQAGLVIEAEVVEEEEPAAA